MNNKDTYGIYNHKQIQKITKHYKNLKSSVFNSDDERNAAYLKIIHLIYKQVKNDIRVMNPPLVTKINQRIEALLAEIDNIEIAFLQNQENNDEQSKLEKNQKIKDLNLKIEGLKNLKLVYRKELFYYEIKKVVLARFLYATNVEKDDVFNAILDQLIQDRIDYIHSAFAIYDNENKEIRDLETDVSHPNFFNLNKIKID
ncbi:hypothetical protein J6W32_02365 [bacterium]|nr:hypothetical protein [bacterium]MBP5783433.1 hypothetical protein [bacterium]